MAQACLQQHLHFCRLSALQWDGASSALDQAVVGPAAGMVQCKTCSALVIRAWALARSWAHMGRLHGLPLPLMRHLHAFADSEASPRRTLGQTVVHSVPPKSVPAQQSLEAQQPGLLACAARLWRDLFPSLCMIKRCTGPKPLHGLHELDTQLGVDHSCKSLSAFLRAFCDALTREFKQETYGVSWPVSVRRLMSMC